MEIIRTILRKAVHWAMTPKYKFGSCGNNVVLGYLFYVNQPQRLYLGSDIYIGAYATIASIGGVRIGNGTIIGPYLHIYSTQHKYIDGTALPFDEYNYLKSVDIGDNVWIGGDVIILPGVSIGEGAVVGAGSVVTKNVLAGHVVAGYPAKTIKHRDMEHYQSLKSKGAIFRKFCLPKEPRAELGRIPPCWANNGEDMVNLSVSCEK